MNDLTKSSDKTLVRRARGCGVPTEGAVRFSLGAAVSLVDAAVLALALRESGWTLDDVETNVLDGHFVPEKERAILAGLVALPWPESEGHCACRIDALADLHDLCWDEEEFCQAIDALADAVEDCGDDEVDAALAAFVEALACDGAEDVDSAVEHAQNWLLAWRGAADWSADAA